MDTLATQTWQAFSRYLSRYQWAFDNPKKSPRAAEIASAILNSGKPGSHTFQRDNGWRYILRTMQEWTFDQAIASRRKLYYVSYGKHTLLYFDIDLHYAWQTAADGEGAQKLITDLMPDLFWSGSSRGSNGYLKVDLEGQNFDTANLIFERLEKAIQRYLAHHENLADFEIKGRVGHLHDGEYQWACYGKLPIHSPDWSFTRLEEFKSTSTVSLQWLVGLCLHLEATVPPNVLDRHKERKKRLGDTPITKDGYFLVTPALETALVEMYGEGWHYRYSEYRECDGDVWLGLRYYHADGLLTEKESARTAYIPIYQEAVTPPPISQNDVKSPIKVNLDMANLNGEPDSFKRQREALLQFSRYLKRVPTLEEALAFIQEKKLYTGTWADNLARRKARVRTTLKYIARTFDAAKCGNGSVNVGKYVTPQ